MSQRLKTCTKCKIPQSLSNFHKDKGRKDGLFSWCKKCTREQRRKTKKQTPNPISISPEGTKWCSTCEIFKSVDQFYRHKRYGDGLMHICKDCREQKDTRDHYEKTYGVKRDLVDSLFEQQNHRCAICRSPLKSLKDSRLDHDHISGKIRGILCHNCNVALGHLKDDPVRVTALLIYLGANI